MKPLDKHINDIVANYYNSKGEERWQIGIIDSQSNKHNPWLVGWTLIEKLRKMRGVKFKIFNRQGRYGQLRECRFLYRKKHQKKITRSYVK